MGRSRGLTKIAKDIDASGNLLASAISPDVTLGGATVYANRSNLPVSGNNEGDQAYVTANNRLYIWNGSGWYSVALLNVAPAISSIQDSDGNTTPFELSTTGVVTTITITAVDSDGDAVTYSATADSDFSGLATLSQDDNVFTVTPFSSDSATANTGTITFNATDGVNIASSGVQTFTLAFLSNLWKDVALSIGMADSDGLTNSTFIERSTHAHTVTANGNAFQSAFHPYLDYWSMRNDGDAALTITTSTDFALGTGDWTIEFWVFPQDWSATSMLLDFRTTSSQLVPTIYSNGGSALIYYVSGGNRIVGTAPALNEWSHIAVTREGNIHKLFLNGTQTGVDYDASLDYIQGTPCIGSYSPIPTTFDTVGNFSNVRIVKGTALYTANFTPPIENLTAVTGTVLLTCQSNRFIDNSSSGHAITLNGNPKISAFNPFGQESEYIPGDNKGSAYFDGDGDYLRVSSDPVLAEGTDDFTLECWFYMPSSYTPASNDSLFAHDNTPGYQISWYPNGFSFMGGGSVRLLNTDTVTTDIFDAWHHLAYTRVGDTLYGFLDGISLGTSTHGDVSTNFTNTIIDVGVNRGGTNYVEAYISDLRISKGQALYTSAFTPPTEPVGNTNASLYLPMDNPGIYDKTGNNTLTLLSDTATSNTQTKFADTAMYFNETDDAIAVYNTQDVLNLTSGPFTVEAWYYQTSSSDYATIVGMWDPGQSERSWVICQIGTGNMGYYVSDDGTNFASDNAGSKPLNVWTHIAFTRDDSNIIRLFINGIQGTSDRTYSTFLDASIPLVIGASWNSGSPYREFPGYIENLQIIPGVAKYTSDFTVPNREQGRVYQAED